MAVVGLVVRLVVYVAVVGGCSAALYGIVTAQRKASDQNHGRESNTCILFASKDLKPGEDSWCRYLEFSAAAQLVLAGVMVVLLLVRVARGTTHTTSILSLLELFLVCPAVLVAISGGCISSAGLGITCKHVEDQLKKHDKW